MVDGGRDARLLARCAPPGRRSSSAPSAARRLEAGEDRDLLALDEPDPPAEEGQQALAAEAEPEVEDVGGVEEEGALLGKEQREAGEVGAARVDLGLGEVGVDGERGERVRAEPLRDVEARLEPALGPASGAGSLSPADQRGTHAEPQAQVEARQPGEQARPARLEDRVVLPRARPAVGLLQPLDAPLDVEPPLAKPVLEAERRDRDPDLGRPARGVAVRGRLPLAVPVLVRRARRPAPPARRSGRRRGSPRRRSPSARPGRGRARARRGPRASKSPSRSLVKLTIPDGSGSSHRMPNTRAFGPGEDLHHGASGGAALPGAARPSRGPAPRAPVTTRARRGPRPGGGPAPARRRRAPAARPAPPPRKASRRRPVPPGRRAGPLVGRGSPPMPHFLPRIVAASPHR